MNLSSKILERWNELSSHAAKLLIWILLSARQGRLEASYDDRMRSLGWSRKMLQRAVLELQQKGYIRVTNATSRRSKTLVEVVVDFEESISSVDKGVHGDTNCRVPYVSIARQRGTLLDTYRVAQEHKCKICNRHEEEVGKLVLDHDHETGKCRGALCGSCNFRIGFFNDEPYRLKIASAYVDEDHSKNPAYPVYAGVKRDTVGVVDTGVHTPTATVDKDVHSSTVGVDTGVLSITQGSVPDFPSEPEKSLEIPPKYLAGELSAAARQVMAYIGFSCDRKYLSRGLMTIVEKYAKRRPWHRPGMLASKILDRCLHWQRKRRQEGKNPLLYAWPVGWQKNRDTLRRQEREAGV